MPAIRLPIEPCSRDASFSRFTNVLPSSRAITAASSSATWANSASNSSWAAIAPSSASSAAGSPASAASVGGVTPACVVGRPSLPGPAGEGGLGCSSAFGCCDDSVSTTCGIGGVSAGGSEPAGLVPPGCSRCSPARGGGSPPACGVPAMSPGFGGGSDEACSPGALSAGCWPLGLGGAAGAGCCDPGVASPACGFPAAGRPRAACASSSATLGIRLSAMSASVWMSSESSSSVVASNSGFFRASRTSSAPSSTSRPSLRALASSAAACDSSRARVSGESSCSAGSCRSSLLVAKSPISRSRTSLACWRNCWSRVLRTSACSARSTTYSTSGDDTTRPRPGR